VWGRSARLTRRRGRERKKGRVTKVSKEKEFVHCKCEDARRILKEKSPLGYGNDFTKEKRAEMCLLEEKDKRA